MTYELGIYAPEVFIRLTYHPSLGFSCFYFEDFHLAQSNLGELRVWLEIHNLAFLGGGSVGCSTIHYNRDQIGSTIWVVWNPPLDPLVSMKLHLLAI